MAYSKLPFNMASCTRWL